jgi:hypothetical protein
MQKRFIVLSTAVVALAIAFSFSARSARADSIHTLDLKLDSFIPVDGGCDLGCLLKSAAAEDRGETNALLSDKHAEFPAIGLTGQIGQTGRLDEANSPRGPFGFPVASHIERREGDGNPDNTNVPEPGSLLLASFGLTAILLLRKARRRNPPFPPAAV